MEVNSGKGTFNMSLESNYTMRDVGTPYKYKLMVEGSNSNQLGGNTV
jgi:hypothetical protein